MRQPLVIGSPKILWSHGNHQIHATSRVTTRKAVVSFPVSVSVWGCTRVHTQKHKPFPKERAFVAPSQTSALKSTNDFSASTIVVLLYPFSLRMRLREVVLPIRCEHIAWFQQNMKRLAQRLVCVDRPLQEGDRHLFGVNLLELICEECSVSTAETWCQLIRYVGQDCCQLRCRTKYHTSVALNVNYLQNILQLFVLQAVLWDLTHRISRMSHCLHLQHFSVEHPGSSE